MDLHTADIGIPKKHRCGHIHGHGRGSCYGRGRVSHIKYVLKQDEKLLLNLFMTTMFMVYFDQLVRFAYL